MNLRANQATHQEKVTRWNLVTLLVVIDNGRIRRWINVKIEDLKELSLADLQT